MIQPEPLSFVATASKGKVSALLSRPDGARWLLVFGHGAGAGMRHVFMQKMSDGLGAAGIATFRYQFPYMEAGGRRPDARPVLLATVRAAIDAARSSLLLRCESRRPTDHRRLSRDRARGHRELHP